jgi:hypothetical protein
MTNKVILSTLWEDLARRVLPNDASEIQKIEMRRAFMAGAHAVLTEMAILAELPPELGAEGLQNMHLEIQAFHVLLKQGLA